MENTTEHFYVQVALVPDRSEPANRVFHAQLFTGTPGHAFVQRYEATRAGDAMRAKFAAINGFGIVDHHGNLFRHQDGRRVKMVECECPE